MLAIELIKYHLIKPFSLISQTGPTLSGGEKLTILAVILDVVLPVRDA